MESCARRSSRLRSSPENSWLENSWPEAARVAGLPPSDLFTSEAATADDELCCGGDIGICRPRSRLRLAATAENESAAAALGHAPVNLRPECGEVIDGRNQRNADHEPDRDVGDPVHREDEVPVNRPLLPAVVKNDRNHGNDLHHHLELAQFAGFDGETLGRSDGAQTADQELAANDDHRDPRSEEHTS